MSRIEQRLRELGIVLPRPPQLPPGIVLPFPWIRVVGSRALISGHGPLDDDGSLARPLGKVGREVSQEQGYVAARRTGLPVSLLVWPPNGRCEILPSGVRSKGKPICSSSSTASIASLHMNSMAS